MKWHTKMIIRKAFALLVTILLTTLFIVLSIYLIKEESGLEKFLFIFLSLFMGIITYSTFKQLIEAINKKKESASINLLFELKDVNQYSSHEELLKAFYLQKDTPLYQDNKIIITNDFFAKQGEDKIFIINGILDVVSFVKKTNGMIDYVSLVFLYYDGVCYEIKYRRSFGISSMQDKANNINFAANIIANKSTNYRKYPSYRFTGR